jgi:cyclic beta-1,2-glucan synthetase
VQPLTIGELWAVAITLRVVLVENLRRMAERIVRSRPRKDQAPLQHSHWPVTSITMGNWT